MSAPTRPAPAPTGPPPAPPARKSRWWLFVLAGVALLVVGGALALAVSAAANQVGKGNSQPFDPQNPGNGGTQALARVLAGHGVDVEIVRGQRQLLAAPRPDSATTVVVTDDGALNSYTAGILRERIRTAGRLVLLNPRMSTLSALSLPVSPGWTPEQGVPSVRANCTTPGIAANDVLTVGSAAYTTTDLTATRCFTPPTSPSSTPQAIVVVLKAGPGVPEVVVAGGSQFTNEQITRLDNAGVGVRMLGAGSDVLWYVPSRKDVAPSEAKPGTPDIPRAIGPLIALACVALLAAMLWRGRRFGKLVVEPLPAVVKAIETTQARGRLYHRARDIPRTAALLRDHTTRRLAKSLGLPARTDVAVVIDAAATASGVDRATLGNLLAGGLPGTDDQLLQYANDLARIEEEVHRRYD